MPTFTNKATLSYNGRTVDSNIVTGNFTEQITVSKVALSESYTYGSKITYVISLVNSGTTAVSGLSITDNLGGYSFDTTTVYPLDYVEDSLLYLINGVTQPSPSTVVGPPLVVTGITIPAGGNAALVYEATVNEFAIPDIDSIIENTVTVSGGGLAENITATETVVAESLPVLTISKSLFPLTVTDNGEIVYTFVITNTGNTAAAATDNAVVTDLFDPILDITSVTLDGTPLAIGSGYSYNSNTGLFETLDGVITVPAATYERNDDGSFTVIPGTTTIVVTGTI